MNHIQKHAFDTLKRFRTYNISVDELKTAVSECGYTIVKYSKGSNDPNVELLLNEFNLKSYVAKLNAFTYADEDVRLVFVVDDLSNDELIVVLAHELGHILLGHMSDSPNIFGKNILNEDEANKFSCYLINPAFSVKLKLFLIYNMRFFVALGAIVFSVLLTLFSLYMVAEKYSAVNDVQAKKSKSEEDPEYVYVTESGNKYHKKWCVYLEYKTNLKKYGIDEIEDLYTPCRLCFPSKFYENKTESK